MINSPPRHEDFIYTAGQRKTINSLPRPGCRTLDLSYSSSVKHELTIRTNSSKNWTLVDKRQSLIGTTASAGPGLLSDIYIYMQSVGQASEFDWHDDLCGAWALVRYIYTYKASASVRVWLARWPLRGLGSRQIYIYIQSVGVSCIGRELQFFSQAWTHHKNQLLEELDSRRQASEFDWHGVLGGAWALVSYIYMHSIGAVFAISKGSHVAD